MSLTFIIHVYYFFNNKELTEHNSPISLWNKYPRVNCIGAHFWVTTTLHSKGSHYLLFLLLMSRLWSGRAPTGSTLGRVVDSLLEILGFHYLALTYSTWIWGPSLFTTHLLVRTSPLYVGGCFLLRYLLTPAVSVCLCLSFCQASSPALW